MSTGACDSCDVYWGHVRWLGSRHAALLDAHEADRRRAYRRLADRDRFTLGAALLRLVVGDRTGVAPECVDVDRTCGSCGEPHGKPRVPGDIEVSVTHSGEFAAVAISTCGPVGVDVEAIGPEDRGSLIDDVCAPDERAAIVSREDFYAVWTRKESVLKAAGVGLAVPMTSLQVTPPSEHPRLLRAPRGFPQVAVMQDVSPAPGYAGAVAVLADTAVAFRTHLAHERMLRA